MTCKRWCVTGLTVALIAGLVLPAWAQQQTGAITGRATDSRRRAAWCDGFHHQPEPDRRRTHGGHGRTGRLSFHAAARRRVHGLVQAPGFTTLNVEGVNLSAGATATINGKLEVATLQESITVTSQSPTIDLESSKVAVNWDQQKLDEIPYSRSLTGLCR